ncbi:CAP domain-containing protein [Alteribacillus iranensis]|uniref:Cysteine-rich secretory protein family protein n=1 Tax=Alteribacillus iranensis TaxID=930128 RepID=A0A1I2D630_9BACI|nr:CAP domain-containing protein [Alteribacillus iranensis]SFE75430.1 Cysteine-rich secretory protein family protein [Alteribacillus iranensis]
MKKILIFIFIGFLLIGSKPFWEDSVQPIDSSPSALMSTIDSLKDRSDVPVAIRTLIEQLYSLLPSSSSTPPEPEQEVETPELHPPEEQLFSVHHIELGNTRAEVEQNLGEPERRTLNEYGVHWEAYHDNYQNFVMVAFDDEDIVRGLYTNQDLISSSTDIELETPKSLVREELGTPESAIRKVLVQYTLNDNDEYDLFQVDSMYVTLFYDKHEDNTVTAIQIIDKPLEQNKKELYAPASEQLKEGLEYQLFDITNAARVEHNLSPLTWADHAKETARSHSKDMAENHYFDHINLEGQSPFDRMAEDNIRFLSAGENLAYAQFSSIYAHEGLMNSAGHRKNILGNTFTHLGVGVAFNEESHPYYTELFFTK